MSQLLLKRDYGQIDEVRRFAWFLEYAGRSKETQRIYVDVLRHFASFVPSLLSPERSQVDAWIRERRQRVAQSTFNVELTALRSFYRWAHQMDHTEADHSALLPSSSRAPARLPRYLTEREVGWLLAAPDLTTLVGYRDHVMMRVLYEAGLRASELIGLEIPDVRPEGLLFVRQGKGRVDRYQPISAELVGLIEAWLRLRRTTRPGKSNTLFVTHRGRSFRSGRAAWVIVNRYARRAIGLGRGYERLEAVSRRKPWAGQYPHLLRASMASHLLKNGCDLRAIQELLGHADIATTAKYLAVDLEQLRLAVSNHPKARKRVKPNSTIGQDQHPIGKNQ